MLSVVYASTGCLVLAHELIRRKTGVIFYQYHDWYHQQSFQSVSIQFVLYDTNSYTNSVTRRVSTLGNKDSVICVNKERNNFDYGSTDSKVRSRKGKKL